MIPAALAALTVLLVLYIGATTPVNRKPQIALASKILDAEGRTITALYQEFRVAVPLEKISPFMRQAVVAVEDERFYRHYGVDLRSLARAVVTNVVTGRLAQGASTITQQTARNLYLTQQKTFGRKIQEAVIAVELERKYTKNEILELYLNLIYFGHGAYGVEAAAQTYFNKPAADLTLAESALLTGVLKGPGIYSPFNNRQAALDRRSVVLERMVATGAITADEAATAKREPLRLATRTGKGRRRDFFIAEVIKDVSGKFKNAADMLYRGGLTIQTTLNLDQQEAAETAFKNGLKGTDEELEGALVAVEPGTGKIRAMVGGRDFRSSQFNRATQARRQPGSAFKPFLYAAAIDRGYTEGSVLRCDPVAYPQPNGTVYAPTDYGNVPYHNRNFTLKEALKISDNIVAVKLNEAVGPTVTVDYAHKLGINSRLRPFLSLALGTSEVTPLEMAAAFATLAKGGVYAEPFFIEKITDDSGNILFERQPLLKTAVSEQTVAIITDMMQSVLEPGGTGAAAGAILGRPAAGKTGTTQNFRDAWFVGFTPELAAAVFIGFDSPNRSVGQPGGRIAGPIWANFLANALRGTPVKNFPSVPGTVRKVICAEDGLLANPATPRKISALFKTGTEPKEYCPMGLAIPEVGQTHPAPAPLPVPEPTPAPEQTLPPSETVPGEPAPTPPEPSPEPFTTPEDQQQQINDFLNRALGR